jgi:hypothetical protein
VSDKVASPLNMSAETLRFLDMPNEEDEDETTFIDFVRLGVLSRAAFELHSFGILNSVKDGHPGFVSDEYLNAISAETTTATLELEAAGLWERRDGGYLVVVDDMLRMLINHNEEQDRLARECQGRGSHIQSNERPESAWIICDHRGVPLQRPDGGPIALPNGGPLGPDSRDVE